MTAGHNFMSDWSTEEYESILGLRLEEEENFDDIEVFTSTEENSSPVDWRNVKDVVTPVKF